jgi:hypothetical protein
VTEIVGFAAETLGPYLSQFFHWRSDTDTSIQLGEAVALSYLRDPPRKTLPQEVGNFDRSARAE